MTLRTLMLLAATAMAVFVAGCGSSQQEDGSNSQHGSGSQDGGSSRQQSEAANLISAGACTGSGDADLPQEDPGEVSNGKIAFSRTNASLSAITSGVYTSRIYVIDEDGTNERVLTGKLPSAAGPVWSPDGERIAFTRGREDPTSTDIYVMDADGTNEAPLADDPATRFVPAWSPDGEQIAFLRSPTESPGSGGDNVYVIDADGTDETSLTQTDSVPETRTTLGWPLWSPDSNKIAFSSSAIDRTPSSASAETTRSSTAPSAKMTGIYVIDVDTAGLCKLTSTAASPIWWSPEGNKITVYDEAYAISDEDAISVINSDGSRRKELTDAVPAEISALAPAPDGEKIAFVKDPGPYGTNPDGSVRRLPNKEAGLYVINPDGSGLRRLANTLEPSPAASPITWSPDSEKIAFSCPAAPGAVGTDLCVMNADGTEWKRIALKVAHEEVPVSVSWGRE
jgi:Tol biopolymer transport system component